MDGIAINIGANTNLPGFRGPVRPDGSFEYIPIPERESTERPVPTYGDLNAELETTIPVDYHDEPVHLDPEFAEYPFCERYTYGDEHGVKASPLSALSAGDYVFFYATLETTVAANWLPPKWGAYIIGQFRLARDPLTGKEFESLAESDRRPYSNNAHTKREPVDARVFLSGDSDGSRLYDQVVPLSLPSGGTDANWLVTRCSSDSGRGPWWRRPLRYDEQAVEQLLETISQPPESAVTCQRK